MGNFPIELRRQATHFFPELGPDLAIVPPAYCPPPTLFYVANRAHHADIGGGTPDRSGVATDIYGEGITIPAIRLVRNGELVEDVMRLILANVRSHDERRGDFQAQIGSLKTGAARLLEIVERRGAAEAIEYASLLIEYSARLMRKVLDGIPDGSYEATDVLDDDGAGSRSTALFDPLAVRQIVRSAGAFGVEVPEAARPGGCRGSRGVGRRCRESFFVQ